MEPLCLGPHMLIVHNYTKQTSVCQEDWNIPHGLDAVVSILLKVLYVYLQPFAAALAAQLEPKNTAAVQGYRDLMFMNMFNYHDLSTAIAHALEPHLGWKLGLNPWQHLQISISRHHGASDTEVLQYMDHDGVVRIVQSGHSLTIQRNNYGVSQESIIGASEQYSQNKRKMGNSDASCSWRTWTLTQPSTSNTV